MSIDPKRFRKIRDKLGFSPVEMAAHLHITNPPVSGRNQIYRYERGHQQDIPGPVQVAMEAIEGGFRATCGTCDRQALDETVKCCTDTRCPFQKKAA